MRAQHALSGCPTCSRLGFGKLLGGASERYKVVVVSSREADLERDIVRTLDVDVAEQDALVIPHPGSTPSFLADLLVEPKPRVRQCKVVRCVELLAEASVTGHCGLTTIVPEWVKTTRAASRTARSIGRSAAAVSSLLPLLAQNHRKTVSSTARRSSQCLERQSTVRANTCSIRRKKPSACCGCFGSYSSHRRKASTRIWKLRTFVVCSVR